MKLKNIRIDPFFSEVQTEHTYLSFTHTSAHMGPPLLSPFKVRGTQHKVELANCVSWFERKQGTVGFVYLEDVSVGSPTPCVAHKKVTRIISK